MPEYVTSKEAATAMGISDTELEAHHAHGMKSKYPSPVLTEAGIHYRKQDIELWIDGRFRSRLEKKYDGVQMRYQYGKKMRGKHLAPRQAAQLFIRGVFSPESCNFYDKDRREANEVNPHEMGHDDDIAAVA